MFCFQLSHSLSLYLNKCELCTKKGENIPKPDADLKSILKSIGSDELIYSMEAMFDGTSCSDLEDLLGITSLLGGQCMNVDFIFLSIYCGCSSEIQVCALKNHIRRIIILVQYIKT